MGHEKKVAFTKNQTQGTWMRENPLPGFSLFHQAIVRFMMPFAPVRIRSHSARIETEAKAAVQFGGPLGLIFCKG
jgi:hypothetical protein